LSEEAEKERLTYPKVDFFGKGWSLISKVLVIGYIFGLMIMLPVILMAMLSDDLTEAILVLQVIMTVFLGFVIVFMLVVMNYMLKHFRKSEAPFSLFSLVAMGIGTVALFLCAVGLLNIENELGLTTFNYVFVLIVIELLMAIPGAVFRLQKMKKGDLFGIYPQVIASAERGTNEYLDGYSTRPVEAVLPGVRMGKFLRFSRFLMRNYLVFDYEESGNEIQLFFPMSMRLQATLFPKNDMLSWIKLKDGGKATVYITPEDYDFLEVPISYHLLCQKVAERLSEAYSRFVEGDEKGALGVFKVKKQETVIK